MPHIIIEYTRPMHEEIVAMLPQIHDILLRSEQFQAADIKIRAQAYDDYCVGGWRHADFVHAIVYLLDGRSVAVRQQLAQEIADALNAALAGRFQTQITVDMREIHRETFVKIVNHD